MFSYPHYFSISYFSFCQALETFLIQENATEILHESKTTGELTQFTRRKLIKRLHDYLKETYGDKATHDDKSALAKATITLFPCLKTNESAIGGIVSSHNPNIAQFELQLWIIQHYKPLDLIYNNQNGGYLGLKVKNGRRRFKADAAGDTVETESIEDDLEFLKSVVVGPHNMDAIESKLKSTANHRKEMMRDLNIDLLESFPIFFSNPQTVIINY